MRNRLMIALASLCAAALAAPPDAAIEQALDRQKGRLYAAYSKALKAHPGLKGRIDLEFTVSTDGKASRCRVLHSELESAQLEHKLCETIESLTFDPRQSPSSVVKRLDFFPAG